jgi:hypothetical protein
VAVTGGGGLFAVVAGRSAACPVMMMAGGSGARFAVVMMGVRRGLGSRRCRLGLARLCLGRFGLARLCRGGLGGVALRSVGVMAIALGLGRMVVAAGVRRRLFLFRRLLMRAVRLRAMGGRRRSLGGVRGMMRGRRSRLMMSVMCRSDHWRGRLNRGTLALGILGVQATRALNCFNTAGVKSGKSSLISPGPTSAPAAAWIQAPAQAAAKLSIP